MKYKNLYMDGNHYERINKTKAKRLYKEGVEIIVYPVNANPHSPWAGRYTMNINNIDPIDKYPPTFDSIVNQYQYYNCNNEMGNYLKYYIKLNN